jgi:glycosyltransferase involved in cell wall biosynthesis
MSKRVAFSYLIPVRDGMKFLPNFRKDIDSISKNSNDQIVIVNDASSDETEIFLRKWSATNPALKVLNNPSPGLVNALNLGLSECNNDWIARFDVDDIYSIDRLSIQSYAIQKDTAAIFCDYSISTINGVRLSSIKTGISSEATRISLIRNRRTPHPGVIFNKEAVLGVGGYRIDDFPCEDLSLWLRLSHRNKISSVPFELLNYRVNPGSISSSNRVNMMKKKYEILNTFPITIDEVLLHISSFQDYMEFTSSLSYPINRVVASLGDIHTCSRIFGYTIPKKNEIIGRSRDRDELSFRKEMIRNTFELVARNTYKRFSNPF